MLEPEPPCLLVVDWMMPGLDGVTLCGRLRGDPRFMPLHVIMLTSRTDPQDVVEGLEAGADDYVTKPYQPAELRARLAVGRRIIDLQRELAATQRLGGVLEMAGAVCHELNQPLQCVLGFAELLLSDLPEEDPNRSLAEKIRDQAMRLGELTPRIMGITRYRSKDYLGGPSRIVDIEGASAQPGSPERGPAARGSGEPAKEGI
jgi:CheY-like chemotaxis protein